MNPEIRASWPARLMLASLLWIAALQAASAYEVLDNDKLRFGTGAEASVNQNGNLRQPFYYDTNLLQWYKLTYSNYPLDNAVGVGGDGTNEWNVNGSIQENAALGGQALDVSGFTVTSGSKGHGTIVSTGTIVVGGATLQMRNTYALAAGKSFVKITTRLTNQSGSAIQNVRVWVGTRDDWVGLSDTPTKVRGNLVNGAFARLDNASERAAALQISTGTTGVLFYSTSSKAHTSISWCCSFNSAYAQNPLTADIEQSDDGSYALYVRMADLADGASEEFTWYYAAGELADLGDIVNEVDDDQQATFTVSATAGAGGGIAPASAQVASGATTAFTITPDAGYSIASALGCAGTLTGSTYTTGTITAACSVNVTFSQTSYSVTATAGSGGSISPASASVSHGETQAFSILPQAGYEVANVSGCGGTLASGTYTTGAVTGACTVAATFSLRTYSVTASADTGGTIQPASAAVNHGATTTFNAVPNAGYSLAGVEGCAGSLTGGSYTTGAITAACAVTASFAVNRYQITASAGEGGSVGPASILANHGDVAVFSIAPAEGHSISSASGCGGSLSGSTYTTAPATSACAVTIAFSATAPVFSQLADSYDLDATGLTTALPSDMHPTAADYAGRALTVTLVGGERRYRPGAHTLTWQATDSRGVTSTVERTLRVWPTVSMGKDVTLGFRRGNSSFLRIALNGHSPVYPFTASYTVTGGGTGLDLESGSVTFLEGETQKDVYFAVIANAPAGSADQQLGVELDTGVNRGQRRKLIVTLLIGNAAPKVVLSASQDGLARAAYSRQGGSITLLAQIEDPNSDDAHTVQWTAPAGASVSIDGQRLTLDPQSITAGVHRFEALVTDNGVPALSSRGIVDLALRTGDTALPAAAEGWAQSGLPDHADYAPPERNVLPERERELHHFLIEADPGVQLELGPHARFLGTFQAEIAGGGSTTIVSDTVTNVGGYFDFLVSDLAVAGQAVNVVVPQRLQIPARAVYRKYDSVQRAWRTFTESASDRLASAPGLPGHCPPPEHASYRAGLNPGDWCVRLTLTDGGPNDDDRQANGVIADPGGVGSLEEVVVRTQGSGGGGAFGAFWLLALACLSCVRGLGRFGCGVAMSTLLAFSAQARERSGAWYAGVLAGQARGEISEADLNDRLNAAGFDVRATLNDRDRTAWRFHAGYQWTEHLAIEAAYLDLGDISAVVEGNVADVQQLLDGAAPAHPRSADGVELTLAGRYPLGAHFALRARAGVFAWDAKYRASDEATAFARQRGSGRDLSLAAGLDWNIHGGLSARADWMTYRVDAEDIRVVGLGLSYRFR